MKLIHYSNQHFDLEFKNYNQDDLKWNAKPNGFWISIEGKYDWKWWCKKENYRLENLEISYEIKLKKEAKILHLKTASQVLKLSKLYPYIKPQWDNPERRSICLTYEIDWKKIKEKYQGIIISPYQWTCRFHQDACWYYG